jgi:hypothetical protein
MKLTPTTTLAAVVLIGAGGFMAGRVSSPESSSTEANGKLEARATRPSGRDSLGGGGEDSRKSSSRSARQERATADSQEERLAKLASIVRGENPLERNRALLAYIDQLGPGDFENAVAGFRTLGITDSRLGEYSLLLTAWAQADPTSALAYAQENTKGKFARDTILTAWGTTDPEAAIRWAQSNYEGEGANPYMAGIIRGLASTDPARATEVLTSMPRSDERGQGLDFMLPQLLLQGTAATQQWIDALPDNALRDGAMFRAAEQLAAADPAATVSWLLANPGEAAQRRMDEVFGVWAANDSQAALSSLSTLPAGEIRSNALRGVVAAMSGADPQAALKVMSRYPNEVTDQLVQSFVSHSLSSDPVTAASQIARIGDQAQRERVYQRTLDRWYDLDPASAVAWAQSNPVPDSVRSRLIRRQAQP